MAIILMMFVAFVVGTSMICSCLEHGDIYENDPEVRPKRQRNSAGEGDQKMTEEKEQEKVTTGENEKLVNEKGS